MASISVAGNTSGSVTLNAPDVAGSTVLTLPTTSANLITDSSGILNIGSGQVYKDASGNMGIGTTGISGRLTLASTSTDATNYYNGTRLSLQNLSATNGNFAEMSFLSANGNDYAAIWGVCVSHTVNATTGAIVFGTSNAASAASERMRIDSSGNVGIGTSSPVTSVTIQAASGNGIKAYDVSTGGGGTWPTIESIGSRGDGNNTFGGRFGAGFRRSDGTAIGAAITLGQYAFGGQWGTGTTYNQTNFLYTASVAGVSEGSFASATAMPTALVFSTGSTGTSLQSINVAYGTERMRIDSSGNLLVGTTSATGAPNNGAQLIGGSIGALSVGHASGVVAGNYFASFAYAGTVIGSITQSLTTGVLYNISSDQRLKTNIQPAGSAIQSILDFPVDQFDWISDSSHQDFGGVAQKILKVIPEMVSVPENPEEMMGVDWSKAVPRLIKTIQELKAIIDTQNTRIEALETK